MKIARAKEVDYDNAVATAKERAPDRPMKSVVLKRNYGIRKIYDNYQVITDVYKNDKLRIRIAAGTLDGYRYIILREFYYSKRDDNWKPGKDGLVIPMFSPFKNPDSKVPTIKDVGNTFLENFTKAMEVAQTMPLADEEKTMYILSNYLRGTAVKAKETSNNEDQQP